MSEANTGIAMMLWSELHSRDERQQREGLAFFAECLDASAGKRIGTLREPPTAPITDAAGMFELLASLRRDERKFFDLDPDTRGQLFAGGFVRLACGRDSDEVLLTNLGDALARLFAKAPEAEPEPAIRVETSRGDGEPFIRVVASQDEAARAFGFVRVPPRSVPCPPGPAIWHHGVETDIRVVAGYDEVIGSHWHVLVGSLPAGKPWTMPVPAFRAAFRLANNGRDFAALAMADAGLLLVADDDDVPPESARTWVTPGVVSVKVAELPGGYQVIPTPTYNAGTFGDPFEAAMAANEHHRLITKRIEATLRAIVDSVGDSVPFANLDEVVQLGLAVVDDLGRYELTPAGVEMIDPPIPF